MATNTFERKIELKDPESIRKLIAIMEKEPSKPLSQHPYTEAERQRSVVLLKRCLSHSEY